MSAETATLEEMIRRLVREEIAKAAPLHADAEMSADDTAALLHCKPSTVMQLRREGKITGSRRGRKMTFDRASVERYKARTLGRP